MLFFLLLIYSYVLEGSCTWLNLTSQSERDLNFKVVKQQIGDILEITELLEIKMNTYVTLLHICNFSTYILKMIIIKIMRLHRKNKKRHRSL